MLDVVFLHPKTGPSALHPHFLLPQAPFIASFYSRKRIHSHFLLPQAKIKDVFRVKIRPFLVLTTY